MSVWAPEIPQSGISVDFAAGINDTTGKQERHKGQRMSGPSGNHVSDGIAGTLMCAALWVAYILIILPYSEPASIQATLTPEAMCPIVGLAGLFGPDGSSFIRHRLRKNTQKSNKEDEVLEPDREDSHPDAEKESQEIQLGEHLQDKKNVDVFDRIDKVPDALKRFDEFITPDEGGAPPSNPRGVTVPDTADETLSDTPLTYTEEGPPDPQPDPPADEKRASLPIPVEIAGVDDLDDEPLELPMLEDISSDVDDLGDELLEFPMPEDISAGVYDLSDEPLEFPMPEDISTGVDDLAGDRPIEDLIDALDSDDGAIRKHVTSLIVARGSEAVAPLIEALSLADGQKRWCFAEVLAKLGDDAIPKLIDALGNDATQAGAAATLVRIGVSAVPPLIAALAEGDGDVHFGARYALQEIGSEAIPFLVEALDRPDRSIRRSASEILGNIGWEASDDTESIRYLVAREAWLDVAGYGVSAIDPLIGILKSQDREAWWNAARTLGEIGEPAINPLIDLLHGADADVEPLIVMALGEIREPAVEPLVGLLSDPALRDAVVDALIKIGEPAVGGCIGALGRGDTDTWISIRKILIAVGEPAIPALIQTLTADRFDIRGYAVDVLEEMGWEPWGDTEQAWYLIAREQWMELTHMGAPAIEPLIRTLSSDDDHIISEAAWTLGEIGDPIAVGPLVSALADEGVAPAAADALVTLGPVAVAPVLGLLDVGTDTARSNAIELLGRFRAHEAIPAIVDLLQNGSDRLHRKAVDASVSIGAPAVTALIPLLGEEGDGYAGAVAALTGIGDAAQAPLVEALGDESARVRKGAAMILERLGWAPAEVGEEVTYLVALQRWRDVVELGEGAITILEARFGDQDAGVQAGAATALARIGTPAVPSLIRLLGGDATCKLAGDTLVEIGEPAIEPLIHALGDDRVSQAAAGVLARIEKPAAVALIPVLDRPDAGDVAAKILVSMGEISIEPLIGALGSDNARAREVIGDLLIEIGDATIVPLIEALGHPGDALRLGAIDLLTRINRPAIPALEEALKNEHYLVRLGAAEILGRIGWEPGTEKEMVSYLIAKEQWASVADLGPDAVGALVRALDDPDSTIQMGAARALSLIGEGAVAELIDALRDERDGGQRKAIEALKMIGKPAVVPLIDALQDRDWHIRLGAARALVAIGDVAVEPLIHALRSGPEVSKMGVTATLGKIGSPAAIDPLIDTLLNDDWRVGRVVVRALGMMGDVAVKPLLRVIREGDDAARKGAVTALVLIGEPAAQLLPGALTDGHFRVRAGVADALDRLGWSPQSGEEEVCYLIAKEQWNDLLIHGLDATVPLIRMLGDRDDSIRRRAAKILGELRDPRAVAPLITLLHDDVYSIRRDVAAALIAIGAPARDQVIAALGDGDDDIRKRAADILAEIGDLHTIEALSGLFDDEDWYVRKSAVAAVKEIQKRESSPTVTPDNG